MLRLGLKRVWQGADAEAEELQGWSEYAILRLLRLGLKRVCYTVLYS